MRPIDLLMYGKKLNNYAADATGGGLWASTSNYTVTVPTGRRWFLLGGTIKRDAAGSCRTVIKDAADKIIWHLHYDSTAGTGEIQYPGQASQVFHGQTPWMIVMDEEEYVNANFGAAQGAGAYASCVVIEVMYEP